MKISNYITLVTCTVLLSCCGSNVNSSKHTNSNNIAEASPVNIDKPANPKMRSQALSILAHRIKNYPETYAVVEAGVLTYEFVHDGRKISKKGEFEGSWIDYKDDFTYDYGNYDEIDGSGRYHFRSDINQLVMIDNNKNQNPQEWDVKIAGDVLILVGTSTYGNNAYQMKLQRKNTKPQKK